jgi:hypothetical protein
LWGHGRVVPDPTVRQVDQGFSQKVEKEQQGPQGFSVQPKIDQSAKTPIFWVERFNNDTELKAKI